ncbi:Os04g0126900, partial [Oryza sativa Japonica Group]
CHHRRPTADLWERRPRHGSSGARLHRRQRAAAGSRSCSRRLEANPAELLLHQLRLTILSKRPKNPSEPCSEEGDRPPSSPTPI